MPNLSCTHVERGCRVRIGQREGACLLRCRQRITQVDANGAAVPSNPNPIVLSELGEDAEYPNFRSELLPDLRVKVTDSAGNPMQDKWVFAMLRKMGGYEISDYQVRQAGVEVVLPWRLAELLQLRFSFAHGPRCQHNLIQRSRAGCI